MRKISFLILFYLLVAGQLSAQVAKHTFTLADSVFLLDNKPFQIISAEMHYPRIPREAWRDRMKKAKAMGINTIGTYVFWNLHEPNKGQYDFEGNNDIVSFIKTAQEEGLWVVVRPSPYVCAEWEFGGYPYWLQNIKGLEVRSRDPKYLEVYKNYLMQVGKKIAPLQINHGGNVLMVQVENEYGSYSNDKEYLEINRKMFVDAGFDGILYTCDPQAAIENGHHENLLPGINGIDTPALVKQLIRKNHQGKGPFFIAEWYPAWFDWWGTKHHTVSAEEYSGKLDTLLAAGISVNMYMFHGGTTRGFMNGANVNDKTPYEPQISSYDYDAPLDEAGNPTPKFYKFREAIVKNLPKGVVLPEVRASKPTIETPTIEFTNRTGLFDFLPKSIKSLTPKTFEELNQAYGFVLYRTTVNGGRKQWLRIKELRDYGIVFVNGVRVGNLDRRLYQDSLLLALPKGKVRLDILVENMGRVNFGPYLLKNTKGITEKVILGAKTLKNWEMFQLPFNDIDKIKTQSVGHGVSNLPVLAKGTFYLNQIGDTYLDFSKWGKGVVWVNGHNLGKYWGIGPQQTVYIPVEWLNVGKNDITIFELLKPEQTTLKGIKKPILDQLQN